MSETFEEYEHRRKMLSDLRQGRIQGFITTSAESKDSLSETISPLPLNAPTSIPSMLTTWVDPEIYKLFFDPLTRELTEIEQGLIRTYFLSPPVPDDSGQTNWG